MNEIDENSGRRMRDDETVSQGGESSSNRTNSSLSDMTNSTSGLSVCDERKKELIILYNNMECIKNGNILDDEKVKKICNIHLFPNLKFCAGEGVIKIKKKDKGNDEDNVMYRLCNSDNNNKRQKIGLDGKSLGRRATQEANLTKYHFQSMFYDKNFASYGYVNDILEKMELYEPGKTDWDRVAFWKRYGRLVLDELRKKRNTKNHEVRKLLTDGK